MMKLKRKIIKIDEALCNGCGNCVPSCPEQALQLVDTPAGKKARLAKEFYCDGLGACIGSCPTGALTVVEEEVEPYDGEATVERVKDDVTRNKRCAEQKPELRQWPVQIHLVPVSAHYFKNADLTIVADCVPFAYANLHQDFLKGNALAVGCPKLDDAQAYVAKLAQIFAAAKPKSVTVVIMEVPCCSGLVRIVEDAMKQSGQQLHMNTHIIGIKGERIKKGH